MYRFVIEAVIGIWFLSDISEVKTLGSVERPSNHLQLQRWPVSCDSSVVRHVGRENENLSPCCCDQFHLRIPSPALRSPPEQSRRYCPARCRGRVLWDEIRRKCGSAWRAIAKSQASARGAPGQAPDMYIHCQTLQVGAPLSRLSKCVLLCLLLLLLFLYDNAYIYIYFFKFYNT